MYVPNVKYHILARGYSVTHGCTKTLYTYIVCAHSRNKALKPSTHIHKTKQEKATTLYIAIGGYTTSLYSVTAQAHTVSAYLCHGWQASSDEQLETAQTQQAE